MPGGLISAFCDPVMTTSTPHASVSSGIAPRLLTASTMSRAGWSPSASRTARTSLWTPVLVSLCVTSTARYSRRASLRRCSAIASIGTGCPPSAVSLRDRGEPLAERSVVDGQHAVARRQEVGDGRLEAARAGAHQRDDVVLGLEDLPEAVQHLADKPAERGSAVVGHLPVHRAEH